MQFLPQAQDTKATAGQSLNSGNQLSSSSEPKRSTLGGKKGAAKKSTVSCYINYKHTQKTLVVQLGAKRTGLGGGLGATKVKTDFAAIEKRAEQAAEEEERGRAELEQANLRAVEDAERTEAALRLAYKYVR